MKPILIYGANGYTGELIARTALAAPLRAAGGDAPPGFQTPAKAYGPDFVLEIDGVTRTD